VVALEPPIGKVIDFTSRDATIPIEIELRFSISLAERDELLRSIALEAPQLKNAVDGLDPNLWLSATLSITRSPTLFAYISNLSFVSPNRTQSERIILRVSSASASELRTRASNLQRAKRDSEQIMTLAKRIDEDDWKRLRDGGGAGNLPRSFIVRRLTDDLSVSVAQYLESMLNESGSFAEFKRGFRGVSQRVLDESKTLLDQPLRNPLDTFSGQESELPKYVQDCLRLISNTRVLYLSERRKPLGKEEAQRLLALEVRRGGNEALKNIQETVHALLGVQIDAFESVATTGTEKGAEMDVDDFLLEVNGAGMREALRLILDFEFQQPGILLVEEPEVHLHPALEIAMMRYLKQISVVCQVFVSTHSTNFLDAGDLRNVYLVSKERYTSVQLLDLEDAQSIIPKELGLRLSSLFMFDRIVFVEGPSDEAVIREYANKLEVNLAQRNVGFIRMGGVRNFTHYANEAILSFLSKRLVEMYFLLDHDEQDDVQVAAIKARLGEKATVHVLRKREIENYLLDARALSAFLLIKTNGAS
jgi:putative ATP-dependent endonuclease of OLD family